MAGLQRVVSKQKKRAQTKFGSAVRAVCAVDGWAPLPPSLPRPAKGGQRILPAFAEKNGCLAPVQEG